METLRASEGGPTSVCAMGGGADFGLRKGRCRKCTHEVGRWARLAETKVAPGVGAVTAVATAGEARVADHDQGEPAPIERK